MVLKILTTVFVLLNPWLTLISQGDLSQSIDMPELAIANTASLASLSVSDDLGVQTVHRLPLTDSYVIAETNPDYLPIRNWAIEEPIIDAKAAIVFDTNKDKILFRKNIDQVLPIASLTKLMTASIAIENLKLDRVVNVSQTAYDAPGSMGGLVVNEKITVRTLLHALLMESSNDAAETLAEAYGKEKFINLMNRKALDIGMDQTNYDDVSGVDPANVSTVSDLIKLVEYSLNHKLIWQISSMPVAYLRSADGQFDHRFINNNPLINRLQNVVGGKTGYTEEARGCMIIVTTKPSQQNLITIVLGSEDRLTATETLVNWASQGYIW